MNKKSTQEFIVAGVAGATGIFMIAMSWPEFKMAAEEHPSLRVVVLGLMLLFMAAANLSIGLKKRSWLKKLDKLGSTTTDCTPSAEK
jgi:hypothetical protein